MENITVKNNEIFFYENNEKKRIGFNKFGLPYLGFRFNGKWHYQHLGNRHNDLLPLISNPLLN